MIKIKETKSVRMNYNEELNQLVLEIKNGDYINGITIPMKTIFQVQRGLTSAIQRFYGKKKNKTQRG